MRKIFLITIITAIFFLAGLLIFLTTNGIKTETFNKLIIEKVNEINPKVNLELKDVNFKLSATKFKFEVVTKDPKILINERKIDLKFINFDLNIFDYLNNKNPISQISIETKENNIDKIVDFINEYDFNLPRNLVLKQIKKGKVKITSDIIFDKDTPNNFKYVLYGSVMDAEIKVPSNLKANNINFDFLINKNLINIKDLELIIDKIFVSSDEININKENDKFEINGNLKTKEAKININNYSKIIGKNLDILNNQYVDLSSESTLSFKIDKKFRISNFKINSKLKFDELYTKSNYQDFVYLKNGNVQINYNKNDLKINLDSKFLFKNKKYNNNDTDNLFKLIYKKKHNLDAFVEIDLSNTKNKINSQELEKLIYYKNLHLPKQEISFASQNKIKFNLNNKNKITNLSVLSKIMTDDLTIDYKSQRIKKYFSNFKNQVKLSQSNFDIYYTNNDFKIGLKSKYSINDENENVNLNIKKKNNNYSFNLDIDLDSAEIEINELDYKKKAKINSNLYIKGKYKDNNEIFFNNIRFNEEEKKLIVENLEISKNDKVKNLDLFKIDLLNENGKKNILEFKKVNDNYYLTGSEFDGSKNIKNILDSSSKSIFANFKNLNTYIYLDIGKYFVNNESYLSNVLGKIQIKNNKIFNSNITAKLNKKRKFKLNIATNDKREKVTILEIEKPEPFIKNFKFIKGFKEGSLIYESNEYEGKSRSNLKIIDFKVQEVPVLAKLLTLASLQGIADLLTGEGIRFSDFEMDYETLGNTTNIKELYAIGPAISLMMEGYIVKDNLTSLKGTLVPATTVNKTISKIPMLGELLVGKKIGEGVFGVSFKIKGPPKKLKTTVNPIKTLTPRFITRTLEKISN